jgi:hypothetical protein
MDCFCLSLTMLWHNFSALSLLTAFNHAVYLCFSYSLVTYLLGIAHRAGVKRHPWHCQLSQAFVYARFLKACLPGCKFVHPPRSSLFDCCGFLIARHGQLFTRPSWSAWLVLLEKNGWSTLGGVAIEAIAHLPRRQSNGTFVSSWITQRGEIVWRNIWEFHT